MTVKAILDGYHTATPYLVVKGAADAIEYHKKAFGASELMRMPLPGGKLAHAEIKIGDSPIMLADEVPEMGYLSPPSIGGTASSRRRPAADPTAATGSSPGVCARHRSLYEIVS